MDNKKEKAGQLTFLAQEKYQFVTKCSDCGATDLTQECVRCLRLFCEQCCTLTPKGTSCASCYISLFPESMYVDIQNFLTKIH